MENTLEDMVCTAIVILLSVPVTVVVLCVLATQVHFCSGARHAWDAE